MNALTFVTELDETIPHDKILLWIRKVHFALTNGKGHIKSKKQLDAMPIDAKVDFSATILEEIASAARTASSSYINDVLRPIRGITAIAAMIMLKDVVGISYIAYGRRRGPHFYNKKGVEVSPNEVARATLRTFVRFSLKPPLVYKECNPETNPIDVVAAEALVAGDITAYRVMSELYYHLNIAKVCFD